MGESIQAVLVRRTLENLAPDVFLPVGGENRSGSHTLNLSIHDYFEAFSGQAPALTAPKIPTKKNSLIQHDGVQAALQMPRLKPANPFEPRHSRQDLLQAYQLSEQDMICHIYSSTIIDSIHTRWWEALIEIGCTRVLLSSAFAPGRFDWPIIKLSELLEKKPSLGEGLVIIHNDTLGRMLDLYAMSDLALVIGPINFFEPLNLGVPSLIFDDEDKEFSRLGYFELVHLALATGGALYLNNYNLLPQAAQQLLSSQPKDKILRPYQSINPRTKNSALQDYLDHLAQVLLLRLHLDHGLNFWQEGEHFVPFAPARDTPKPSVFSQ